MITKDKFIEKSREIHGDKYDYAKVEYSKVTDKVCIVCPEHGEFWQEARQHYRGQGCPKCGVSSRVEKKKDNTESFIKKARKVHGDRYDYSKVEYVDSLTKVCIICPEHGEFWTRPDGHLSRGYGCPKCSNLRKGQDKKLTTEDFIKRAKEMHGDRYDYSKVEYSGQKENVCIICPKHGEFWQNPYSHYSGYGCPKCAREKQSERQFKTTEMFIKDARKIHGDKYDYSKTKYVNCHNLVKIICPQHGVFEQTPTCHLLGSGCQKCNMIKSQYEDAIFDFLKTFVCEDIKRDDRTVLRELKQSLDLYIPSHKFAIEFDGLYWHNEVNKDKNYHLKKTEVCKRKGIQLIHIFEDEWIYKQDIVKSRIKNLLGSTDRKLYARKCKIIEISNKESRKFCNENHLQGSVNSSISLGLYYNDELVSVMTFGRLRKNLGSKNIDGQYELLRFCNKINTSVIGAASKLLNHFIKTYNPTKIVSYADKRWSQGNMYEKMGFNLHHESKPNYYYVFGDKKKNRFCFRKDILVKKYGCPKDMSEHDFCLSKKWYRIYDCGCLCYVLSFS